MADNQFKPGNQFWKMRTKHGVDAMIQSPHVLYESCVEYFEWIEANPMVEEKVGFSKGKTCRANVYHPRAMTIKGISSYLGITDKTWYDWRKNREDLIGVIDWAEQIIWEQKFSNAAAGLLNANIISRELGLADKQIHDVAVPQMVVNPPSGPAPEEPPIHGE